MSDVEKVFEGLPVFENIDFRLYHREHPNSPVEVFVNNKRVGGFPIKHIHDSVLRTMNAIYEQAFKDGQNNRSSEIGRLLGFTNG